MTEQSRLDQSVQMSGSSQCVLCVHKRKGTLGCDAFPDVIPVAIAAGEFDHRDPYPGDNGVRWELDPNAAALD